MHVSYRNEAEQKLRVAVIGCGGHCYRNILPTFAYLPVDFVAACDIDLKRAEEAQRVFGATAAYSDHQAMLKAERPDAVLIITGYTDDGRCRYPELAAEVMRAGAHVWVEKPPLNNLADVALLRSVMAETGKQFAAGLKKMYFPANRRLKRIIDDAAFGRLSSIAIRYPQYVPTVDEFSYRGTERARWQARVGFLDHICHPFSLLQLLGGRVASMSYIRESSGAAMASFTMQSGAIATMHLAHGQSASSPLERVEVIGSHSNAVIENNTKLTWYRPVTTLGFRQYGRDGDFTGENSDAPLTWEPEFSLGTLANKSTFILGYHAELQAFCEAALRNAPVTLGTLDHAEEGIRIYDAFAQGPNAIHTITQPSELHHASPSGH
jgi:predicted dehydrogenase